MSTYGFQNIYITDGFRHFSLFLPHKTCQIKLGNCSGRNKNKICIGDIEAANAVNDTNSFVKEAKIFVPLKYFSNFWRSLEMIFINCKIYLELNWIEDYILSSAGSTAKLAITHTKLHFPIVTLSTKDSANLAKQLNEGFERSVYWNSYETKPEKVIKQGKHLYELPNASFKVLIDGGNFYDQPINDLIKQYDEIRKVSTGYGDDYTTGCLSE